MFYGFLIGLLLGILLQCSQFCFVSGFRQLLQRDNRQQKNLSFLTTLLIAVFIQSIGLFVLAEFNILEIPNTPLPLVATVIGGLLFGVGMVLANCCGSGAWFRSGEGAMGSLIALFAFSLTLATSQSGALKNSLSTWQQGSLPMTNIQQSLNISPWWLVMILGCFTFYFSYRQYQLKGPQTGSLPFWLSGILLGILGLCAWYSSVQTGRNYGFGVAVPTANVVQYLVTGQQRYLNWGTGFVLGILVGSFICARYRSEFIWRIPPAQEIPRRIVGGLLMGIGATLAGGCTLTNSFVATAYFSWQGWIASCCMLFAVWLTHFFFKLNFFRGKSCN